MTSTSLLSNVIKFIAPLTSVSASVLPPLAKVKFFSNRDVIRNRHISTDIFDVYAPTKKLIAKIDSNSFGIRFITLKQNAQKMLSALSPLIAQLHSFAQPLSPSIIKALGKKAFVKLTQFQNSTLTRSFVWTQRNDTDVVLQMVVVSTANETFINEGTVTQSESNLKKITCAKKLESNVALEASCHTKQHMPEFFDVFRFIYHDSSLAIVRITSGKIVSVQCRGRAELILNNGIIILLINSFCSLKIDYESILKKEENNWTGFDFEVLANSQFNRTTNKILMSKRDHIIKSLRIDDALDEIKFNSLNSSIESIEKDLDAESQQNEEQTAQIMVLETMSYSFAAAFVTTISSVAAIVWKLIRDKSRKNKEQKIEIAEEASPFILKQRNVNNKSPHMQMNAGPEYFEQFNTERIKNSPINPRKSNMSHSSFIN